MSRRPGGPPARPTDVVRFHDEYTRHPDDRLNLFRALTELVAADRCLLYPGSYIDIDPSVWFDDVTYVDVDKRANRFFDQYEAVRDLITERRRRFGRPPEPVEFRFHHCDYREPVPVDAGSVDLLVSLYAGFISEHCSRYLKSGGLLLANNSHGDASMAALDPDHELVGVVLHRDGRYRISTDKLDGYLQPKRGEPPTAEELHRSRRGIAYTRTPFAYLFRWNGPAR